MDKFLDLTVRELEVLSLLAQGKTNKAIAGALYIPVGTVNTHIKSIFKVIEVNNRTAATRVWRQALYGGELPSS
jgi:DNA-binding NarL/FixJ family response regulator